MYDPQHNIPAVDVGIDVPSVKTSLSEEEYSLITSMAGENFSEAQRMPQAARWLQRWADGSTKGLHSAAALFALGDGAVARDAGVSGKPQSAAAVRLFWMAFSDGSRRCCGCTDRVVLKAVGWAPV